MVVSILKILQWSYLLNSLKQAIDLTYLDALTWNKEAKYIDATSIDSNDEEQTGNDGRRRY